MEELYGLCRQELELQGENAAFSNLSYRIEVQPFYYREGNLFYTYGLHSPNKMI